MPGVDLEHIDAAGERIGYGLEYQCREWSNISDFAFDPLIAVGTGMALGGTEFIRRRSQLDQRSQQGLYSDVWNAGRHKYREQPALGDGGFNTRDQVFVTESSIVEILLHQRF